MNLQEDINRNKELMNIVNLSDLNDAGTWSADALVRGKKGRGIYTYEKGKFVKRNREPEERNSWSWGHKPKEVFYLTNEEAETVNTLMTRVIELELESKKIREDIKKIIGSNKKYK
jgi:hypothetical protein